MISSGCSATTSKSRCTRSSRGSTRPRAPLTSLTSRCARGVADHRPAPKPERTRARGSGPPSFDLRARTGRGVKFLAAFDQESAQSAGERTNDRDGVDLHHDVEDSRGEGDRVLETGGDGQQLGGCPKQSAAETLDLGLLLMVLEQERQDTTDDVESDRRQSEGN